MAFALWIGKSTLDREWNWYQVVFSEAVSGLTVGGAVQYNGIQVGEVRRLSLDPIDPGRVIALVRVGADVPVKVDTQAKLSFVGLTGVSLIQLSGGSRDAPRLLPGPDGAPPAIIAEDSAVQKLLASSEDIATTTSQVLVRINQLLSEENTRRVARSLENLERVSSAIAAGDGDIRNLLARTAAAAERLAQVLDRAETMIERLDDGIRRADAGISEQLPPLVEQLRASLGSLQRLSADGERLLAENRGAINDFSQQGLGQVGPLLVELRRLIVDLDRLTERLDSDAPGVLLGRDGLPEYQPQ